MSRRIGPALVFSFGIFILSLPIIGQTQLVLYDDFRSASINPSKWLGSDFDSISLRDAIREVVRNPLDEEDRALHLFNNAYALQTSITEEPEGHWAFYSRTPLRSRTYHLP
jgi:hypothetical protein